MKVVIGQLQQPGAPAQRAFSEDHLQLRETWKHLREENGADVQAGRDRARERGQGLGASAAHAGLDRGAPCGYRPSVDTQGHPEILAGRPNRIVLVVVDVRHVAQELRQGWVNDPPVAVPHRSLDLRNRRVHGVNGHDALRDETLAGGGPFFNQPVVVGPHARLLELVILDATEGPAPTARHRRIQNGKVHAVSVHGLQPFGWPVRGRGDFRPALGLLSTVRHQCSGESHAIKGDRLPIDDPSLRSIGLHCDMGNAIPPAFPRQPCCPHIRRFLYMVVDADEGGAGFHRHHHPVQSPRIVGAPPIQPTRYLVDQRFM